MNSRYIIAAAIFALASCSQNARTPEGNTANTDSIASQTNEQTEESTLFGKIKMKDTIKVGEALELQFTVYNNADSIQNFCKWHTPFEPLLSKYLDVKNENGEEVNYIGPMAKRVMPPPASSYVDVNPHDSLSVEVDLLQAYAINTPGKYTLSYSGQGISNLAVQDTISFIYIK